MLILLRRDRVMPALAALFLILARCDASTDHSSIPEEIWRFIELALKSEIQPLIIKLDARLDTLDSRLDLLDSRVDVLTVQQYSRATHQYGRVSNQNRSRLDSLASKLDSQGSRMDGLTSQLDSQDSRLDGLASQLDSQDSRLNGLASQLYNQDSRLDVLASQLDSQDSRLDSLVSQLDSQDSRQDGLASQLDSQDSRLDVLASQLDSLVSQLDSQDSRQDGLASQLDSQDSRLGDLASQIDSQDSRLDTLAFQLNSQDSRLNGLATETRNHQTPVDGTTTAADAEPTEQTEPTEPPPPCDCSQLPAGAQSGVHLIRPDLDRPAVPAFCDLGTDGGNWTVFQRRAVSETQLDFFRDYRAYREGFGDLNAEFWWGLDHLWMLTSAVNRTCKQPNFELRIDLEDFDGGKRHAVYQGFQISSEKDGFRLAANSYTGNAGNSLRSNIGQQFTTRDKDQDLNGDNCAREYQGAWWYSISCGYSNLNGRYLAGQRDIGEVGIDWEAWRGFFYSLKTTEMKMRPSG